MLLLALFLLSNPLFSLLLSLSLQAVLDHFGYEVGEFSSWEEDIWYDQRRFDLWFGVLRKARRSKDIMPFVSSDEDEDDDHNDGRQASDSGDTVVSQPDESERGPRTPRQASPSSSSLSDEAPIEEGMEYTGICTDIAADCDQVIVKDNLGTSLGSFDTTFPFVSLTDDVIDINPLALCKGITKRDFERANMYDPRKEDVNMIIAVGARGIFPPALKDTLNEVANDWETSSPWYDLPSLSKFGVISELVFYDAKDGFPIKRRKMELSSEYSYDKTGWVKPFQSTDSEVKDLKRNPKIKSGVVHCPKYPKIEFRTKTEAFDAMSKYFIVRK